ncbi:MAG: hypothetical protein Q4F72_10405, partial [Desulfovibrionaceae bacterium]|nr:hypothetical protein [Desulfovibrionaceae bacterium]
MSNDTRKKSLRDCALTVECRTVEPGGVKDLADGMRGEAGSCVLYEGVREAVLTRLEDFELTDERLSMCRRLIVFSPAREVRMERQAGSPAF